MKIRTPLKISKTRVSTLYFQQHAKLQIIDHMNLSKLKSHVLKCYKELGVLNLSSEYNHICILSNTFYEMSNSEE